MPQTWSDKQWFACYVALGCVVALGLMQLNWFQYRALVSKGVTTQARVLQTMCNVHNTFSYEFTVEGSKFSSTGGSGYGNPDCRSLKSGDLISVTYPPQEPNRSVPGDVGDRLMNETITIGAAALSMPAFIVLRFRHVTRNAKRKAA